jgi:hypothetical protein
MSTQAAETTVRSSIVVQAPIERAFRIFTEDFGRFKPPSHNLLAVDIAETVFEPRVGGYLYDRGVPLVPRPRVRAAAPGGNQLGYQPALADRD